MTFRTRSFTCAEKLSCGVLVENHLIKPEYKSIRSVTVVLPASMCAMIPMFLTNEISPLATSVEKLRMGMQKARRDTLPLSDVHPRTPKDENDPSQAGTYRGV